MAADFGPSGGLEDAPPSPLTVAWLKQALRDLESRVTTPAQVLAAIEADKRRLWSWPEFQDLRVRKLGSRCEECGSVEVLTLQHLRQPKPTASIRMTIQKRYTALLKLGREYHAVAQPTRRIPAFEYIGCPGCGARSYYARRTKTPKFRCTSRRCEFDEPAVIRVAEEEVHAESFKQFLIRRTAEHLAPLRAQVDLEIARSAIGQLISYFAGDSVVTACKRCAYRTDAARMERYRRPGGWG